MTKKKSEIKELPLLDGLPFYIHPLSEEGKLSEKTVSLIATALVTADPSILSDDSPVTPWGTAGRISSLRGDH